MGSEMCIRDRVYSICVLVCIERVYGPGDIWYNICLYHTRRGSPRCQQPVPCYHRSVSLVTSGQYPWSLVVSYCSVVSLQVLLHGTRSHGQQTHRYHLCTYHELCRVHIDMSGSLMLTPIPVRHYAIASAGLCDSKVSVSLTHRYCVKTRRKLVTVMISSPSGSLKILVF